MNKILTAVCTLALFSFVARAQPEDAPTKDSPNVETFAEVVEVKEGILRTPSDDVVQVRSGIYLNETAVIGYATALNTQKELLRTRPGPIVFAIVVGCAIVVGAAAGATITVAVRK